MKLHRNDCPDVLLPRVRRVHRDNGRKLLLWLKLEQLANGQNDLVGAHGFGEFF